MKRIYGCAVVVLLMIGLSFPSYAKEYQEQQTEGESLDISNLELDPELYLYDEESDIMSTGTAADDDRKVLSVLGDSLGTYKGYTPWGIYYQYYSPEHMPVSDTWWMRYMDNHNMRLGMNESLGGSKVAWQEGEVTSYRSDQCMASQERIDRLGENGTPDTIIFFGGTNDIGYSDIGIFTPEQNIGEITTFYDAYQTALVRIKNTYPDAEIICMIPYHRDIRIASGSNELDNDKVDAYAEAIINVCDYYGVPYVDLRKADIDWYEDMCSPDYFHVNEKGAYKIWYMLENGCAQLKADKDIVVENKDGSVITAQYEPGGADEDTQYQWSVYDIAQNEWNNYGENNQSSFCFTPPHDGGYWLHCKAVSKSGMVVESTVGVGFQCTALQIEGICWQMNENAIDIGMAFKSSEPGTAFRWMAYNLDTKKWEEISGWGNGNWASWKPWKGNYWLQAQAKTAGGTMKTYTICFRVDKSYPVYINGKYQGPNPDGDGYLLGVSTNENPDNKYQYEMLVMDCSKYLNGDPNPWVYGTGLNTINGNTFWSIFKPAYHGGYWTYFRVYNENGVLVDDRCYGAHL